MHIEQQQSVLSGFANKQEWNTAAEKNTFMDYNIDSEKRILIITNLHLYARMHYYKSKTKHNMFIAPKTGL